MRAKRRTQENKPTRLMLKLPFKFDFFPCFLCRSPLGIITQIQCKIVTKNENFIHFPNIKFMITFFSVVHFFTDVGEFCKIDI